MTQHPHQFVQEFARHHERLFAYVFSLLPNRFDAEDVFQRASVTLWQKFDQYEPGTNFLSWACTVAFYEVRNFLRVSGRSRLRFSDDLLSSMAEERTRSLERRDDRLDALDDCLKRLESAERELLDRAYRDESRIKDLAQRDGRAVQTLYNRLNQIRRKLMECVDSRGLPEAGPA